MKILVCFLFCIILAFICIPTPAYAMRDDVLIIVNDNSIDSPLLGSYYAQARDINPANIVHLRVPDSYFISWNDFRNLRDQLINFLQQNTLDDPSLEPAVCLDGEPPYYCTASTEQLRVHSRIRYLVTTRGVPTRMHVVGSNLFEPDSPSSVDNYLKYWLINYFGEDISLNFNEREVAFADGRDMRTVIPAIDRELIVGRIDGLGLNAASKLVDRALTAENAGIYGTWYGSTKYFSWHDEASGATIYPRSDSNLLGWRYALGLWDEDLPECIDYLNFSGTLPEGKAPPNCRVKFNDDFNPAAQTTNGISYPAPGNVNSREPKAVNALGYQGWLDGQAAIGSFNALLNWRKDETCNETLCDNSADPTACRATSTDYFAELNTACVGTADGFMAYNHQSYPVSYMAIWPTGWFQSDKTGSGGFFDNGHGDLYQLAFPEVRSDDGFVDINTVDTNSLWFRNTDQVVAPLCYAGSDFSVVPTVPCTDQRRLVLTQRITHTQQALDAANPQTYRISLRYKTANMATTVPLQVRFFVHETGTGNAQIDYGVKTLATLTPADTTDWTATEVLFTLDPQLHTVGTYDGIKITLDTPGAFAGDLGIDVVSVQETTAAVELVNNGSFALGHKQVTTGDHAANFLNRFGGVATWGSVGHHQSGGSAFNFNGLASLVYFLRGLPLGDAVWFDESNNSGILYGDPLYSPVAVRIKPVNACDTVSGNVDLFGSTVNGRDLTQVSTTYQVDACPGDDFFLCDQSQWIPTGISGSGGGVDQLLGSWDSSTQAPGAYVLRLSVTSFNTITGLSQTLNDYYPISVAPAPPGTITPQGSLLMCASAYSVAENDLAADITVIRIGGSSGAISVEYSTSDGSATAGSDYTAVSGILNFADGDTLTRTVTVPILDDTIYEGDETLNFILSNPTGGAGLGGTSSAVVSILENDSPSIRLSSSTYSVAENGVTANITVTRDSSSGVAVVSYATSDGTALDGSDYSAVADRLIFANGVASQTISIPVLDDQVYEGDENLTITLSNALGALLGSPASAELTIIENDPVPASGNLQFSSPSYAVTESGVTVTLTVTRVGGSFGAVSVDYTSSNGSATAGSDYTAVSGTLTFADGDSVAKTFSIPINDDAIYEGNETINLSLNNVTGGASLGTPSSAVLTILDNDPVPPSGSLQFSAPTYSVNENGVTATLSVTRTGGSFGAVSVDYTSSNGSATAGSDYTAVTGTINFANGDINPKTFSIALLDDISYEGDETINLTLSNAIGASLGTPSSAELTILENDLAPPSGILQFSAPSYNIAENAISATITVTRIRGSFGAVSVDYASSNGSATAGSDYTAVSGTLNFADGDSVAKTFSIPITDDAIYEGNETVNLILSNAIGASLATPASAVLTILENDPVPPSGSLQFSDLSYGMSESGPTATISVTRLGGSFGAASVNYASSNGSATAGSDYTAVSGTLNFANGDTTIKTFNIPINDDVIYEGNETVNLILSNAIGASLGTPSSAALTIIENDPVPSSGSIQFSSPSYAVVEGGVAVTITATRIGGSFGAVSVDYASSNGSATAGSDYTAVSGTLNFANGDATAKTFSIPINDDAIYEGNETVNLVLSNAIGASLATPANAVLTIIENDPVPSSGSLQFSAPTYSVNEISTSATITVTRVGGSFGAVSVDYASSNGSATSGSDYSAVTGTLNFANGDATAKTFSIPIHDDAIYEGNETVNLVLSNAIGASLATPTNAVLTIFDNDPMPPSGNLQFSTPTYDVNENGTSATIIVTRVGGSFGAVSVDYASSNGSATAGSDYTAVSGTLNFADGVVSRTVTLRVQDDSVYEGNETVNMTLSNPVNSNLGSIFSTVISIIDDEPVPPAGSLVLSAPSYSVDENSTVASITVNRVGGSFGVVSVDYATSDVVINSATAGDDYSASSGTLSFIGGEISKTISIQILDDFVYEGDESLQVMLANPVGGAGLGSPATAILTIKDDEPIPPVGSVQLSALSYSVTENSTSAIIKVIRVGGSFGTISVDYTTSDGSATAGSDYTAVSGTLNFADGELSRDINIPILNDSFVEGFEFLSITLSNPTGGTGLGSPQTAKLNISDDDSVNTTASSGGSVGPVGLLSLWLLLMLTRLSARRDLACFFDWLNTDTRRQLI